MFIITDQHLNLELQLFHQRLLLHFDSLKRKLRGFQVQIDATDLELYYRWKEEYGAILEKTKQTIFLALKKPNPKDGNDKARYFRETVQIASWCNIIFHEADLDVLSKLDNTPKINQLKLEASSSLATALSYVQREYKNYNFLFSFQLTEPQKQSPIITDVDQAIAIATAKLEANKRTALILMRPSSHLYQNISTHSLQLARLSALKASTHQLPKEEQTKLLKQTIRLKSEALEAQTASKTEQQSKVREKNHPVSNILTLFTHFWKKNNSPEEQFKTALNPNKSWVNPYRLIKLLWHLHQKPARLSDDNSFESQLNTMFEKIYSETNHSAQLTALYYQLHSAPIRNIAECLDSFPRRSHQIEDRKKALLFKSLIIRTSNALYEFIHKKCPQAKSKATDLQKSISESQDKRQKLIDTFDMFEENCQKQRKAKTMSKAAYKVLLRSNKHYFKTAENLNHKITHLKQELDGIKRLAPIVKFDFTKQYRDIKKTKGIFQRTRHTLEYITSIPIAIENAKIITNSFVRNRIFLGK